MPRNTKFTPVKKRKRNNGGKLRKCRENEPPVGDDIPCTSSSVLNPVYDEERPHVGDDTPCTSMNPVVCHEVQQSAGKHGTIESTTIGSDEIIGLIQPALIDLAVGADDDEGSNSNSVQIDEPPQKTMRKFKQPKVLNATPHRRGNLKQTLLPSSRQKNRNPRHIKFNKDHIRQIELAMDKMQNDYYTHPWPIEQRTPNQRKRKNHTQIKCRGDCTCSSPENCLQNAIAYNSVAKYVKWCHLNKKEAFVLESLKKLSKPPTNQCHSSKQDKCASVGAHHKVDYFSSGHFGDAICDFCEALLLLREKEKAKTRQTLCCSNGEAHTEMLIQEFSELQNPPVDFIKKLVGADDRTKREMFKQNTKPLNTAFGFACVQSEQTHDLEQLGGRRDLCKINGAISFCYSDMVVPEGKQPQFAQAYALDPEEANNIREDKLSTVLRRTYRREIIDDIDKILRRYHPYAKTFKTAAERVKEVEASRGSAPNFQIVLLNNRTMNDDAIKNRNDCIVVEDLQAPTAKQVAVVWVQEDGLPPEIPGFTLADKAGRMHKMQNHNPNLDPSCFPLLHPRGTQGWRLFMKKQSVAEKDNAVGEHPVMEEEDDAEGDAEHVEEDNVQQQTDVVGDAVDHEEFIQNDPQAGGSKVTKSRKYISERVFYRYRMAMRKPGRNAFHWLWYSRRLAELYTISILNRIERNEMEFLKKQQEKMNLRQIIAKDYLKAIEKGLPKDQVGAKLGRVFMMPATFAGSRQYYMEKYANLMKICQKIGAPTWFVTFTGNPQWPEIQAALAENQDPLHRADVVCRIFIDKATEFIKDVTERNVLGTVGGFCYSVEHQKRGMPHIHLLLILKDDEVVTPDDVDKYVCARIPPLPAADDESPEAHQQRRLWHVVTSCMLHDCNAACLVERKDGRGYKCKKHFPKPYSEYTKLSSERYAEYVRVPPAEDDAEDLSPDNDQQNSVQYRRLRPAVPTMDYETNGLKHYVKTGRRGAQEIDDRRVVSYNAFLLLKYACHINIEYVFGQKSCKYIFKYLLKGFTKAYVACRPPTYDYDEVEATFKVRYMTSLEAYLRLVSFPIVKMSHQIVKLSVHEEDGQTIVIEEGFEQVGVEKVKKDTKLMAFFKLCESDSFARQFRFDQIPYYYTWNDNERLWRLRFHFMDDDTVGAKMFVRVYTVSPKKQELFAIRVLLLNRRGPKSFPDLRTVDGIVCDTFTEAAQKLGLLESDAIYVRAMADACIQLSNLHSLRRYFANLLFHCTPSNPQAMFDDFLDELFPPPAVNDPNAQPLSKEYRRGKVLRELEYFFRCMGTNCSERGLAGLPSEYDHEQATQEFEEAEMHEDFYGAYNKEMTPQTVFRMHFEKLNPDQKAAFHAIAESIVGGDITKKHCFFLKGFGGVGKTYVYNTLIRWCLAGKPSIDAEDSQMGEENNLNRSSVIAAASTGVAGLLLIGGSTVHQQFFVPNEVDSRTPPLMPHESVGAERIRMVELIIIDEVSMLHGNVFNYVDRLLRDICSNDKPFGGKTNVVGGDYHQLAPVVVDGTKIDQIKASVKSQPLFNDNFTTLELTINMRTSPNQTELRAWLRDVCRGVSGGKASNFVIIPPENRSESLQDIIDWCFPSQLFEKPLENADLLCDNALLCPTNDEVNKINDTTMERIVGDESVFESIDSPLEPTDITDLISTYRSDFNLENINNERPQGFPPHIIKLKVGVPVMMLRNFDRKQGLANGTRLQIMAMSEENLLCRILTGPRADANTRVLIPRIKFEHTPTGIRRGLPFRRIQFPVNICFAMTINKAQGQTLKKVGLVLNKQQCFSHGHLYTALSRVTEKNGIRIFTSRSPTADGTYLINNPVWNELIDDPPIRIGPTVGVNEEDNTIDEVGSFSGENYFD